MKAMVKDLKIGDQVQSDFLLKDIEVGKTSRGSQYLRCTLLDKSGTLPGVMWDAEGRVPTPGIYSVTGICNDYKGRPQVKMEALGPRASLTDEDFMAVSQFPVDQMWDTVCNAIIRMSNIHIRTVATHIMHEQGYEEGFKSSPAATSMHHAFVGGLLEHTSQMVETAEALFGLPFYRNSLNKDLCMFGIIFHDFCKMMEYQQTAGFKKTIQGILVPHIPLMGALIFETCNKFEVPEVVRDHMMHVVLAHHGCQEYGSPVEMAIPEAAFVHHIDNLHGDVFGWIQKIATNDQIDSVRHMQRTLVTQRFDAILKACDEATSTQPQSSPPSLP